MTMYSLGTIREFETAQFKVIIEAVEEPEPDISFDETTETRDNIDSGKWIIFCARARVIHKSSGLELASDCLGNCIYESLEAFMDHKACAAQNREREEAGDTCRSGSYFSEMVHNVCAEARKTLNSIHVRKAQ